MLAPGQHISGWMTLEELDWLYQRAGEMKTIVEIGCWLGRSTFALCCGCPGKVYAVDHFQGSPDDENQLRMVAEGLQLFDQFLHRLRDFANLRVFPMPSVAAASSPLIPKEVDMVFIDGCHSYEAVIADLTLWAPRARTLVAGHDIDLTGVAEAVKDYYLASPIHRGPEGLWYHGTV